MVDKENKQIKILDYKTLEQNKKERLNEYAAVLENKLEEDYIIETDFLNIEL